MDHFNFAAMLEAKIRQELETMATTAAPELLPFLTMTSKFQVEFELLLDRAQYTNVDTGNFPEIELSNLLGLDSKWQEIIHDFGLGDNKAAANLTALWMIQIMTEKSGQYYLQAAANSPHPAKRLFFSSLAELKNMLRRRTDSMLRVQYNVIWADIGFAPFKLGEN